MLEDTVREIDSVIESIEYSRTFLKELSKYRDKLGKSYASATLSLKTLQNKNVLTEQKSDLIITEIKKEAPEILKEEILKAVRKNREYNYHLFLNALFDIAKEPGLFTILTTGVGWSTRLIVDIEFLGYAGTLNDWAKGVKETRDYFNVGKGDAEKASKLWRQEFYRKGPYNKIIRSRIEKSDRPAAFWLLLDKGTVALASDRGGTAYPHYYRPTNFIDYTIDRIKKAFNSTLREQKKTYDVEIKELERQVSMAREYLELLDSIVNDISIELEKNKSLYNQFNRIRSYIDQDKLDNALVRVRNNLDIGITKEGRIELTARGSSRRVRPSIGRLRTIVESY